METITTLAYLVAASLFILGLKRLSSPRTARAGNRMAAVGMLVAVAAALLEADLLNPIELLAGLLLGAGIGVWLARTTEMTSMPELVAAFNGFGGAASALVAAAEVFRLASVGLTESGPDQAAAFDPMMPLPPISALVVGLSVLIGSVTLTGSFVAYGKLRGSLRTMGFPGLRIVSVVVGLAVVGAIAVLTSQAPTFPGETAPIETALIALAALSLGLGVLLVLPIGGADMPVVVALLNSYSGLAAAAAGFVLANYALIVSGALVGASGFILTMIMCDAMNRSLANVLLGGFGADAATGSGSGDDEDRPVRETTPDDAAVMMSYAQEVVIIPGYGLAVAQAQHEAREMAALLQEAGVSVRYAIHPVAGRMPGHMNVLLAEANVPYDQLIEMDEINASFPQVGVALVVGANDVVNPAATDDPSSPIAGMPVLHAWEAEQVVVMKRSMSTGYAGIPNPLFFRDNTAMLFGDAKDSLKKIIAEIKALHPS